LLKTDEGILIDKPREKLIWEITNESKTIGDYLCYKATCIKSLRRDGKEKHTPATVFGLSPVCHIAFGPGI
jgi:GLPGLI family protein